MLFPSVCPSVRKDWFPDDNFTLPQHKSSFFCIYIIDHKIWIKLNFTMVADTVEELYLFKIGQSPYDIFSLPQYASFFFGIGIIGNYIWNNLGFDYGSRYF